MYNNTEVNKQLVWETARAVWGGFASSEVARAFILPYRILRLIVDENDFSHWLSDVTPHCDVRRDFYAFEGGIKPKNGPSVCGNLVHCCTFTYAVLWIAFMYVQVLCYRYVTRTNLLVCTTVLIMC